MPQEKQPTYYEFFNLPNFETDAVKIKRAYRSMALKWHPDRNTDKSHAEYMMKQVNEIYRILSQDKNAYDHHLRAKLGQGPTQKKYQKSGYKSSFENGNFWFDEAEEIDPQILKKMKEDFYKRDIKDKPFFKSKHFGSNWTYAGYDPADVKNHKEENSILGTAGEEFNAGDTVYMGPDGKFYKVK